MNRLLIAASVFVALLMTSCEDWDSSEWRQGPSSQSESPERGVTPAPEVPGPSGPDQSVQ
jgi:hypothetical protein